MLEASQSGDEAKIWGSKNAPKAGKPLETFTRAQPDTDVHCFASVVQVLRRRTDRTG